MGPPALGSGPGMTPGSGPGDGTGAGPPGGKPGTAARPPAPEIPPYAPFPTHLLPPIPRAYVEATAAAMNCDLAYSALPVLAPDRPQTSGRPATHSGVSPKPPRGTATTQSAERGGLCAQHRSSLLGDVKVCRR